MPIYEYRCNACRRLVSVLARSYSPPASVACDHCGSTDVRRLLSRVSVLRSEESRFEQVADSAAGLREDDPRSVGRWLRKMGPEFREDLGPDFGEMADRMEAQGFSGEEDAGGDEDLGEED